MIRQILSLPLIFGVAFGAFAAERETIRIPADQDFRIDGGVYVPNRMGVPGPNQTKRVGYSRHHREGAIKS